MKYLQFTQYIYLIFAAFFVYDGVVKMNNAEDSYLLSFGIAAVCIFMFFFRRSFFNKAKNRNNNL
jgi:high-affinity Fe2+/Pb2+ permease